MFSKLNTKDSKEDFEQQLFNNFLFDNKKDPNNITRQILNGSFKELFLNFDYFYNNFSYFINQLGIKMSKNKVKALLNERYLLKNPTIPEITGDISEDMLSSYYCKYEVLDTAEEEIYSKNYQIYNEFLKNKYKSSIPMIKPLEKEKLSRNFEIFIKSDYLQTVCGEDWYIAIKKDGTIEEVILSQNNKKAFEEICEAKSQIFLEEKGLKK